MTAPRAPRPLRAAAAVLRTARVRRGGLVDDLGFPAARHPENMTGELTERDEEWLACVADALWPHDEYTEIIRGGGRS